jgi:Fur family peroxide stress response transcriptional regulator
MIIKQIPDAKGLFRARKLPVTHQRLAVFEALRTSREHPSAETLYKRLKPGFPALSLATVYKTLRTLQRLGLAAVVDSPSAQTRYDAITQTHHHLICLKCGRIADVFDEKLDAVKPPRFPGFAVSGHSVHFRGLCKACNVRRSPNRPRRKSNV